MNPATPTLASGTGPTPGRKGISVGIITGLIGGFLVLVQVVNVDEKATPSSDVGTAVLVFGAALGFVILIHELGHLVAGWLLGFRFSHIRVGPLRLYLNNGKLNIGLLWETTALGDTAMRMDGVARLRRRLIVYVLGGTGAIALSVPITVVLANRSSFASMNPFAVSFAAEFTFISIILTIVNLMPAPLGSRSATDGSRLATLLSDRKRGRRYLAICGLRAQNQKGIRPKDWRQTWLKVACSVPDQSVDDFWGNWFAYKSASARNDKDVAGGHLETCLRLSCLQTQTVRRMLLQEAAFFSAWFLQNMPLANKWLAQVKMRHGMPLLTRLQFDIATLCSRNEFCEALRIWETVLAQLQALPEIEARGTLLGDWLDFGDQIQVRQSEAAAAAVPAEQDRLSNIYDKLGVFAPGRRY